MLDIEVIAVVAGALLIAGTVKGAVGFGLPTLSVALMGSVLELRQVVPLIALLSLFANLWQSGPGPGLGALIRRFWMLNGTAAAGIWLGTVLLFTVDPRILVGVLGIVLCTYSGLGLRARELRLPTRAERPLGPAVGMASGVLCGMTGSILVPLVVYLQSLTLDRETFVRAVGLSLFVASVAWVAAHLHQGSLGRDTVVLAALSVAPAVAGMLFGRWCGRRISPARFRIWVYWALLLLGANLIRKALA